MTELDPEVYEAAAAGDPEAQAMVEKDNLIVRGFDHISWDSAGGPFDSMNLHFPETE